jgi:hypothetical protein
MNMPSTLVDTGISVWNGLLCLHGTYIVGEETSNKQVNK